MCRRAPLTGQLLRVVAHALRRSGKIGCAATFGVGGQGSALGIGHDWLRPGYETGEDAAQNLLSRARPAVL